MKVLGRHFFWEKNSLKVPCEHVDCGLRSAPIFYQKWKKLPAQFSKRREKQWKIWGKYFSPQRDLIDTENAVLTTFTRSYCPHAQFFCSILKSVQKCSFSVTKQIPSKCSLGHLQRSNDKLAELFRQKVHNFLLNDRKRKKLEGIGFFKKILWTPRMQILTTLPKTFPWKAEQVSINFRKWMKKHFCFQLKYFISEKL